MPVDYNGESRGFGLEIQLRQIVQYIDRNAAQLDHRGVRQFAAPPTFVDVAAHSRHRGNGKKFFEDAS